MRWVGVTDTNSRVVWINAQNVAYVQDFQTYRAIHFVGSKDNYFQAKDTAEDLVMMLRPYATLVVGCSLGPMAGTGCPRSLA